MVNACTGCKKLNNATLGRFSSPLGAPSVYNGKSIATITTVEHRRKVYE
ncbi:MAG TPA: hypothetical protein VG605_05525 [Puia sp.]|nr:hypothetical protein [Puia sp.]